MQTISRHFVQQEDAPPSSRSNQVSVDIDNGPSNQASMDIDNVDDSLQDLLRNFTPDNVASSLDASRLLPTNPSVQLEPDMNVFSSFCRNVSVMPHGTPTKRVAWFFMVLAAGDMGSALCVLFNMRETWQWMSLSSREQNNGSLVSISSLPSF